MKAVSKAQVTQGLVDLRIPAAAEWVAVARLAVAAVANRLSFSYEEIEDVKLAVAEACTNCIHYAAPGDDIDIRCEVLVRELQIRVRHAGPSGETDSRNRGPDEAMDGLGVFLIQSLMDTVEYTIDPKTGIELRMSKRLPE
ncbi:MAG TPA: ATP-binding protein [Candidatus Baltobacteraceae bacterium]|jgi:serine/threonine-protein kinase RsbW|nr:ATP-binding protein [Candidatus Baltobacteraceae bacterium]